MKKSKLAIIYLLLLFVISACTKNSIEPTPPPALLKVGGTVVDSSNIGLGEVKIYFNKDSFVVTNAAGNWQLTLANGDSMITPVKVGFTFTPAFVKITASNSNLIFRAQKIPPANWSAKPVYDWFTSIQLSNGLLESAENSNVVSRRWPPWYLLPKVSL